MANELPNRSATWPNTTTPLPNSIPPSTQQPSAERFNKPRGERVEGIAQTVIMLAIGGAAGAASFTHVHDVAAAHGQPGWLAWTDAVTLELASIAAGLDLRRRKRIGNSVRFPAAVLTVAVILSLSAQVVEAEASVIGWIAAALPALGFLAMVKMAMGRADHGTPSVVPDTTAAVTDGPGPVPDEPGFAPDEPAFVPDGPEGVQDRRGPSRTAVDVTPLLSAATQAAQTLAGQGVALNRDTLARQMRADGHPLSTAAATALTRLLRDQPADNPVTDAPGQTKPSVSPAQTAYTTRNRP
jgi:hypothetical protein